MKELEKLKELIKAQCSDGNWNYDEYMRGMANGMILAEAVIEDKTPVYLDPPDVWLKDKPEGCSQCPHAVGDIRDRDCGYPDCVKAE